MNILVKQRLTGAVVLVSMVVVFIPMLLSSKEETYFAQAKTNIPPTPTYEFNATSMEIVNQKPQPKALSGLNIDVNPTKLLLTQHSEIGPIEKNIQSPKESIERLQPVTNHKKNSRIKKEPKIAKANKGSIMSKVIKSDVSKTNVSKTKVSKTNLSNSKKSAESGWIVQVGSFKNEKNALRLNGNLRTLGYSSFIKPLNGKKGMIYRVRVGPEFSQGQAEKLQEILDKEVKLKGLVMRY